MVVGRPNSTTVSPTQFYAWIQSKRYSIQSIYDKHIYIDSARATATQRRWVDWEYIQGFMNSTKRIIIYCVWVWPTNHKCEMHSSRGQAIAVDCVSQSQRNAMNEVDQRGANTYSTHRGASRRVLVACVNYDDELCLCVARWSTLRGTMKFETKSKCHICYVSTSIYKCWAQLEGVCVQTHCWMPSHVRPSRK